MAKDRYTYGNHISCTLEDFPETVQALLDELTPDVRIAMTEGIRKTVKEGSKVTKKSGTYENRRPKYRKSIKSRVSERGFYTEGQIYAGGHEYSLTHLLENGHHLWNAPGRMTRAFPHWEKGEDFADDTVVENVIKELEKRGIV